MKIHYLARFAFIVATVFGLHTGVAGQTTAAGQVIISEFRLHGPGPVNNQEDEFIELYNNTDAAITVTDVNPPATGQSGWAIVSSDAPAVAKAIVPTGVTIPPRGHYLIVNSDGYSLNGYAAGNNGATSTTATGDRFYTTDIPGNTGIALFRSANPANFTLTDRLDAFALYRDMRALNVGTGQCAIARPKDTDNNAADFLFVDPNGTSAGAGQRLGAAGPENLSSPIYTPAPADFLRLDSTVVSVLSPNQVRNLTSDPGKGPGLFPSSNLDSRARPEKTPERFLWIALIRMRGQSAGQRHSAKEFL